MLDFTALWCRLGQGEVLAEEAGHGRAEVPGEHILDDGTAGATLDREIKEKLNDVRVALPGSRAESVVVIGGRVNATLQRQIEKTLDDVRVANQGSEAQCVVVIGGRVDATLQRQIEKKLNDVRMAVLGSEAESVVVIGGRVDATLQLQIEKKLDDGRVAVPRSVAQCAVVIGGRVDATLLNKVSHRGDGAGPSSSSKRGCVKGNSTCLAQVLQDNVSVLHHPPRVAHSSARRLLPAPIPMLAEGVDLTRPVKAALRKDGDS